MTANIIFPVRTIVALSAEYAELFADDPAEALMLRESFWVVIDRCRGAVTLHQLTITEAGTSRTGLTRTVYDDDIASRHGSIDGPLFPVH